jgi:hypothetical protein
VGRLDGSDDRHLLGSEELHVELDSISSVEKTTQGHDQCEGEGEELWHLLS